MNDHTGFNLILKTVYKTSRTLLLLCLLTPLFVSSGLAAHDPNATPSEDVGDFVSHRDHGLALTVKLVPTAAIATGEGMASAGNEPALSRRDRAVRYAKANAKNENLTARVGELAYLVISLERGGQPVSGTEFELVFHHIEDDKQVFQTGSGSTEGVWVWGQQFFDGAEHLVSVRATGGASQITADLTVAVEGISPPGDTIFRSMLLLLAVVAFGMVLGYVFGVRAGGGRNL